MVSQRAFKEDSNLCRAAPSKKWNDYCQDQVIVENYTECVYFKKYKEYLKKKNKLIEIIFGMKTCDVGIYFLYSIFALFNRRLWLHTSAILRIWLWCMAKGIFIAAPLYICGVRLHLPAVSNG